MVSQSRLWECRGLASGLVEGGDTGVEVLPKESRDGSLEERERKMGRDGDNGVDASVL